MNNVYPYHDLRLNMWSDYILQFIVAKYQPDDYKSSFKSIPKTRLFKYIENYTSKNWNFSDKKLWYF